MHVSEDNRLDTFSWLPSPRLLLAACQPAHVAAICYRLDGSRVKFLLVQTRAGRWTFPKGKVENDPNRAAAAAREALEEAGVFGRVESRPICRYIHRKQRGIRSKVHFVDAHLCEVVSMIAPEEMHRNPTWFDAKQAKQRLSEKRRVRFACELSRVVDRAIAHIARRSR
jgi:8-oxo-dGTP pyrophosphatase MutT (NUDIX family)